MSRYRLASIGYERWSVPAFLEALVHHGIQSVLDVRARAFSHRPAFRKGALATALHTQGIRYVHLVSAGNPYRDTSNRAQCLAQYQTYINDHAWVVDRVVETLDTLPQPIALLCYERHQGDCHRHILLDALRVRGLIDTVLEIDREVLYERTVGTPPHPYLGENTP